MTSLITSEPVPELHSPQLSKTTSASQHSEPPIPSIHSNALTKVDSGPRSIITPATEYAPRGKIIDDLARGTIFWEVDNEEDEITTSPDVDGVEVGFATSGSPVVGTDLGQQSSDPGRPSLTTTTTNDSSDQVELLPSTAGSFKVEWLSTRRVPFYSTRGLRNPWNVNREVKIARDGTELEPSIGKKLVALFGHPGIGRVVPMGMAMPMNMNMNMSMVAGMGTARNPAAY